MLCEQLQKKNEGVGIMAADRSVTTTVFNIQTYCIHDGPGIRVTVFVKGCPLRCTWCANPESNLNKPQMMFYKDKCTGCGRCAKLCPMNNITLQNERPLWGGSSNHCNASNCYCPTEAIEYGKKSPGKPRYHYEAL